MQRRSPGVEARFAVRIVDSGQQVAELLPSGAKVVVILESQGDAEIPRAAGGFAKALHNQFPLIAITARGRFIPGEDTHQVPAKIAREPSEVDDVAHHDLAHGHLAVLEVRGEVVVAGDDDSLHAGRLKAFAQAGSILLPVIEDRNVRALGREKNSAITQRGGLLYETIDTESGLAPKPGVAHRVKNGQEWHTVNHTETAVRFQTEHELEEFLATPSEEDRAALRSLDGDLLLLGAGGKMGPSLARRARRAAPPSMRVIAVSRYSDGAVRDALAAEGVITLSVDLLAPNGVDRLPDARNVLYLAARKFGTGSDGAATWATNAYLPGAVAQRYANSRIVSWSTGNVYPFFPASSQGPDESVPLAPVGEYGQSALARERVFEYFAHRNSTPLALLRLNYAIDVRYGVLVDLARKVKDGAPIDLTMGHFNCIWQGDANSICLRALAHCAVPPFVINVTGTVTHSVREAAVALGKRLGVEPQFTGVEAADALLSNAARLRELFGPPSVSFDQMLDAVADWTARDGRLYGKPTHFEVRDGRF